MQEGILSIMETDDNEMKKKIWSLNPENLLLQLINHFAGKRIKKGLH